MRVDLDFVDVPTPGRPMRAALARPRGGAPAPGIVLYSDIFQLTPSTLRMVTRFAGHGFTVLAPEIYYRREASGTAWAFDDAGRVAGMAAAKATPVAEFDEDAAIEIAYVAQASGIANAKVGIVGFCLGGHLAFRAAFSPRVAASICYYPTGLHNGALGADDNAGSLERAGDIQGLLHAVFGTEDPHVPPEARAAIEASLVKSGIKLSISQYPGEHAFMRDEGPRYDPQLTDAAFAEGVAILHGALAATPVTR